MSKKRPTSSANEMQNRRIKIFFRYTPYHIQILIPFNILISIRQHISIYNESEHKKQSML